MNLQLKSMEELSNIIKNPLTGDSTRRLAQKELDRREGGFSPDRAVTYKHQFKCNVDYIPI